MCELGLVYIQIANPPVGHGSRVVFIAITGATPLPQATITDERLALELSDTLSVKIIPAVQRARPTDRTWGSKIQTLLRCLKDRLPFTVKLKRHTAPVHAVVVLHIGMPVDHDTPPSNSVKPLSF